MRKPRKGEYVCRCRAYRFPHRFGGGRCSGSFIASQQLEQHWGGGDCASCNCLSTDEGPVCDVVDGREHVSECPVWQEFVQVNEIKVYK